jgi:integrase
MLKLWDARTGKLLRTLKVHSNVVNSVALTPNGLSVPRSRPSSRSGPRPHMLRHACGYAPSNKGHDTRAIQGWLGHRSITSTAVYTALAPNRFKGFWRE